MKKISLMLTSVFLLVGSLSWSHLANAEITPNIPYLAMVNEKPDTLNKIVAIVDSSIITQKALEDETYFISARLKTMGRPVPPPKTMEKEILQRLINITLQEDLAKRYNIKVTQKALNQGIQNVIKNAHTTLEAFKSDLKKQGLNFKIYKSMLKRDMLLNQLHEAALGPKVKVEKTEIAKMQAEYQKIRKANTQYQIKDYLIAFDTASADPTQTDGENVLAKAKLVYQALQAKKAIPDGVKVTSFPMQPLKNYPTLFVKPLHDKMKKGDIYPPIKASNGFHVIELVATQTLPGPPILSKAAATQAVYRAKINEALGPWLKKLRGQIYIKTFV